MNYVHVTLYTTHIFHYLSIPFENLLLRLKFFRFFKNITTCIKKIYISITNHWQNSFNKFLNFRNIHPKNKNPSKKVSSILLVFFNLEIPLGYTEVEKNVAVQWIFAIRENVEIVGIVKSAGHRGEQLYNPNLSRDFRPLICFLASRNRNRGLAICCERTIDLPTNFVEISLITRTRLDLRHFSPNSTSLVTVSDEGK